MLRPLGTLLLLFALASCAKPLDPGLAAGLKTIGVYSSCADHLWTDYRVYGGYKAQRFNLASERLDGAALKAIEAHIAGRIRLVPARPVAAPAETPSPLGDAMRTVGEVLAPLVRVSTRRPEVEWATLQADEPVDGFLWVASVPPVGEKGWINPADGIFVGQMHRHPDTFKLPPGNLTIQMNCRLEVRDSGGAKAIASQEFQGGALATPTVFQPPVKTRNPTSVDDIDYTALPPYRPWDQFTDEERSFVQGLIKQLLSRGVAKALVDMQFPKGP